MLIITRPIARLRDSYSSIIVAYPNLTTLHSAESMITFSNVHRISFNVKAEKFSRLNNFINKLRKFQIWVSAYARKNI